MEPWQEEDLRQLRVDRRRAALTRCHCCDKAMDDGAYLDLEPFGLSGIVCEECVGDNTHEVTELM